MSCTIITSINNVAQDHWYSFTKTYDVIKWDRCTHEILQKVRGTGLTAFATWLIVIILFSAMLLYERRTNGQWPFRKRVE